MADHPQDERWPIGQPTQTDNSPRPEDGPQDDLSQIPGSVHQ